MMPQKRVRLLGIDFSGDVRKWSPLCSTSNVWVAIALDDGVHVQLEQLMRIQELPGRQHPFARLVQFLRGAEAVAAIDAPFSVPKNWVANAQELWQRVSDLPKGNRPFATGRQLIQLICPGAGPNGLKDYRQTENRWRKAGINVRSTVWDRPRGGAPFAAAAMTLLALHDGPVWPFPLNRGGKCLLVEAFPAAQLRQWSLPFVRYGRSEVREEHTREAIVSDLQRRGLKIGAADQRRCLEIPDALDAVICLFAAKAVTNESTVCRPKDVSKLEGLIAVHQ